MIPLWSRLRGDKTSTPLIVVGSLLSALGLTAAGDTSAQAHKRVSEVRQRLVAQHNPTELHVLSWAIWNIIRYYVEPGRIDPPRMTTAGLDALEQAIPEVLVQPLDDGRRVRVRVGTAERDFEVGDVEAPWAAATHLRDVFRFVVENTSLSEDEQRNAEYAIISGVLGTLDPHTNLLRPEDFEDMRTTTKGSFGGLGIEVGMRDGAITVIRVLDDTPASKVDMRPGDRVVRIDDESTVTMGLSEAVDRLRGAPGTVVNVYTTRDGSDKPLRLRITRATIKPPSVLSELLRTTDPAGREHKVGLVKIPRSFAQTTGAELREKLKEFESQNVEGLVLDLRGNPGGLLTAAVEVADAFVRSGTIVATVGSSAEREENRAEEGNEFPDLPVVVLADQGSASASEIVAGALANLGRAVVLGRRTFGKGSVQVLREYNLPDKELALKITIAQYLTPGDVSIQSVGVQPDLETIPVFVREDHLAYFGRGRIDLVREESLTAHLKNGAALEAKAAEGPYYFLAPGSLTLPGAKSRKAGSTGEDDSAPPSPGEILRDDPEVRLARDLVLFAPSAKREEVLAKLPAFVASQVGAEEARIAKSLAARGIDWQDGPAAPAGQEPRLHVAVRSDHKDNALKGGETGAFTVSVRNDGLTPAYRVRAITASDNRSFDELELLFGRIDPGKTREFTLKLAVAEHELSRTDRIDLHFFQSHKAILAADSATSLDLSATGLPRPAFSYGYQIVDDPSLGEHISGNADGTLQVGERVQLRVSVRNQGPGTALDTWVNVYNLSGDALYLHSGRQRLRELAANASRIATFDVELKKAPEHERVKLELSVSDNKIGELLSDNVLFPVRVEATPLSAVRASIETARPIDIFASPFDTQTRVIGRTLPAGRYAVTGEGPAFVRLQAEGGAMGFVRRQDATLSDKPVKKPSAVTEVFTVSPPHITLMGEVTQTDLDQIHLSGIVTDEEMVRDVFITVFNPSKDLFGEREKIFYQASPDPRTGRLQFAADVPLTPGNNLIEIFARQDDNVQASRRMWVLRTSGLAKTRAERAKARAQHDRSASKPITREDDIPR